MSEATLGPRDGPQQLDDSRWLLRHARDCHSQNGEDGILARILDLLPDRNLWCVEFGAWDGVYLSNTRHLIETQGYKSVLIEANPRSFRDLVRNNEGNPDTICINVFVGLRTDDGLDAILRGTACPKYFDLLSVDIDGNDYHVWKAITAYRPKVVCIEFNPMIPTGVEYAQPADSTIMHGASVSAITLLGKEKGYELVCINACNCFFVDACYFSLFGIDDNSVGALRPNDPPRVLVFAGYNGDIISTGDVLIPWLDLVYHQEDLQLVPWAIRKYPYNQNFAQRQLLRLYKMLRKANNKLFARRNRHGTRVADIMLVLKDALVRAIGERHMGYLDFFRFPDRGRAWGGPFNGQQQRRLIYLGILARLAPTAIVETGTYLGTTTEFLAETANVPIHSIEAFERRYGYAAMRLRRWRNVRLHLGSSPVVLRELMNKALGPQIKGPILFYLDAHWGANLPLADEIEIIFHARTDAIVMIDDFAVPDDPGYAFDDYGPGRALTSEYLAPLKSRFGFTEFYPAERSSQETGAKRGCVVLAGDGALVSNLMQEPLLRRWAPG